MFKFYQRTEKTDWIPIQGGPACESKAREAGAVRLTILEVSDADPSKLSMENAKKLSYKGPLYFDIDNKDDLTGAIASARKLVGHLLNEYELSTGDIEVFCSGSKGMHVIVDAKTFSAGRPVARLPEIYREMALRLHVPGMDFQVYSGRHGVSWRLENVQRADGNYRVRVTHEELQLLTAEKYKELCAGPRQVAVTPSEVRFSPKLENLWEECRKAVQAKEVTVAAVPEKDMQAISKTVPACVSELSQGRTKSESTYNQVAFQIGVYIARSGCSNEQAESIMSLAASRLKSSQYSSERDRLNHIHGVTGYARSRKDLAFSCAAMRSVMANNPCEGCPIYKVVDQREEDSNFAGIEKRDDGYYIKGKVPRRISTYTVEVDSVFVEAAQDGTTPRRLGALVDVYQGQDKVGHVYLDESAWDSRPNLQKALHGVGNLMFLGDDKDVSRVKFITFEDAANMNEVTVVTSAGIHISEVRGRKVMTYVEPDWSVNSLRVVGTHFKRGDMVVPPNFKDVALCEKGSKDADEALYHLLCISPRAEMFRILGFFAACHLRMHFKEVYNQFPFLNIWGASGSGKSKTAGLVSTLNGCDYIVGGGAVGVPNITPFALLEYCSSSTTVPRILDEYNKSKMSVKSYNLVGEVIKKGWDCQMEIRGAVDKSKAGKGGAYANTYPITAPMVVLNEQAVEWPAHVERALRVMLAKRMQKGREVHFAKAWDRRNHLKSIGKALMFKALQTQPSDLEGMMERVLGITPTGLDPRPTFSLQVAAAGFDFMLEVVEQSLGLEKSAREMREIRESYLLYIRDEVAVAKDVGAAASEVDLILDEMALMAAMYNGSGRGSKQAVPFENGVQYVITSDKLFLDTMVAHALYKKHMGRKAVVDNARQFQTLLEQEPYYIGERSMPSFQGGRPVAELDLNILRARGVNIGLLLIS